jgi:hypothetical protein
MAARAGAALAVTGLVASTGTMAQNAKLSDLATLAGHWRRDISRVLPKCSPPVMERRQ